MCHYILGLFSSVCLWLMQKSQESYRLHKDLTYVGCRFFFKKENGFFFFFLSDLSHLFESWSSLFTLNC